MIMFDGPGGKKQRSNKRKCQLSKTVKKPEKVKIFQHSMTLWDVNEQSAS